jgi:hypothetical protein
LLKDTQQTSPEWLSDRYLIRREVFSAHGSADSTAFCQLEAFFDPSRRLARANAARAGKNVHNAPKLGCAFREYAHELHSCNTNGQLDFTLRDQNHSATDFTLYSSTLVATSSDIHLLGTLFCASETGQITGIPPPLHAVEQRTLYLLTFIHYSGRIGTFGRRFNRLLDILLRAFDLDGMDNPLFIISKPMKRRID